MNNLKDIQRVNHILDSVNELQEFTKNKTCNDFLNDRLLQLASVRLLEIIGEAANKLSEDYKSKYPAINWKSIVGFRNIIVHEYFGLDYMVIWDIITNEIDTLKTII